MCGIAAALGVVDARSVVERMARALAHRGPDDAGACTLTGRDGDLAGALAHRRLAIIDLSAAAHQPMASAGGRFTMAFNGEIYNYRRLRAELERDDSRLAGAGDTAVLLEGWARHGPAFVERLEGMFAFVVWDSHARELFLVRDRFGIKPLYVASTNGGVVIASELRALLASECVAPCLDHDAVAGYLAFGAVPEPSTIVAGARMVPAGAVFGFRLEGRTVHERHLRSLAPVELPDSRISDRREAAAAVRTALERSVERHLESDVPVTVFLSGGLDSSGVAALAARHAGAGIDGFTVTFTERRFDEREVARTVARRFGIRHHEIPLGGDDLLAALPAAFAAMDQPTLDGINTWVVSQAVRAHGAKVVLSGLGGDELFAGYPSFRRARALARYARLPAPAKAMAARLVSRVGGLRGAKVALGLRRGSPADAAYLASRALFGDRQIAELCRGHAAPMGRAPAPLSLLQQVSWRELTGYMRNTLLRDSDVFSMAHGLELRVPFVEREVVTAAFAASDPLKLGRGVTKPLLVEALADVLPREVWDRPKQGFVLPFADWMRGPLASEVAATLGDTERLAALGLSPRATRGVWEAFVRCDPGVTWSRPWALYSLVRWASETGVERPGQPAGAFAEAAPA